MSKYQPKIIINNPEKHVPSNIVEQFFLAIKTADLDRIRDFAITYKNKFNLFEPGKKGSLSDTGKTPIHIVLELDDKIANNDTKMRIIKYLDQMGAPLDLPDSLDIWPIHLAVNTQSEEIVDFFLKKQVRIDRKDTSGNTPLHYAISGQEIACPRGISIKDLTPPQKLDKLPLNETFEDANRKIIGLLNANPSINEDLIHMINTIMKIPEMYAEDNLSRTLEKEVIEIFTDIAMNPTYPSDSQINGLTNQQNKIEQLIDRTYSAINDELFRGLTNAIELTANNSGWGPTKLIGATRTPPSDTQRITKNTRAELKNEMENDYQLVKKKVIEMNTAVIDNEIRTSVPRIINTIDRDYDNPLVFCPDCITSNYGEDVALSKILLLLMLNDYRMDYGKVFAIKIMDNFSLLSGPAQGVGNDMFSNILRRLYYPAIILPINIPNFLLNGDLVFIVNDLAARGIAVNNLDQAISNLVRYYATKPINSSNDFLCISRQLYRLFAVLDEPLNDYPIGTMVHDEYNDGILGTTPLGRLMNNPLYSEFQDEFNQLFSETNIGGGTWFQLLSDFIDRTNPRPGAIGAVFPVPNSLFNIVRGFPVFPNTRLPASPLPNPLFPNRRTPPLPNARMGYSYLDIFRLMKVIGDYLTRGGFDIFDYPDIFGTPINQWEMSISLLANTPDFFRGTPIGKRYPEFILLYKILIRRVQSHIHEIISNCIQDIITKGITDPDVNQVVRDFANLYGPMDNLYMYSILLPTTPVITQFTIANPAVDPFFDLKSLKWDNSNTLVTWFKNFRGTYIRNDFRDTISANTIATMPTLEYQNLNKIRRFITDLATSNTTDINSIVQFAGFRNTIRRYFGVTVPQTTEPIGNVVNSKVVPRYNKITNDIQITDYYATNLRLLKNGKMTDLFFLTEFYGSVFVETKQLFIRMLNELIDVQDIIVDIIAFINNRTYYYIPQIFLPALLKKILIAINFLIQIREYIKDIENKRTEFYSLINLTNTFEAEIFNKVNTFVTYINKELNRVYGILLNMIQYHNDALDFLNYTSAINLLNSQRGTPSRANDLFTMNLILVPAFPDLFTDVIDYETLNTRLRMYKIPVISYYADDGTNRRLKYEVFGGVGPAVAGNPYIFDTYRGVIEYERKNTDPAKNSNAPNVGDNSQLNITALDIGGNPRYTVHDIPDGIAGQWLTLNAVGFMAGFIAYQTTDYQYNWIDGMPPSIRKISAPYLQMIKQEIIEKVIQTIYDIHNYPDGDPRKIPEIEDLYQSIKNIGNETTYTDLNEAKIHIVIGKITDSIINKILEYVIKQSIGSWILGYATSNSQYHNLVNHLNNTINIIRQKEYLRLSLSNINKDVIQKTYSLDPKYLDYHLVQIEPNPREIKYATKPIPNDLIHYLYNINYFSTTGNINSNKKCYQINPKIASKLMRSTTINSKNSDGNTPLHMAIEMAHPELVEKLVQKGAKIKGFTNIRGKTPFDLGLEQLEKHLNYTNGIKLIDTIDNFVKPFNDLLLTRLKDETYGNNIVRDISLGIPIQLVMYNHMFYLYLENYRYGFTSEIKNTIKKIIQKYFNGGDLQYPFDLLKISDPQQLSKIIAYEIPENKIAYTINESNQKKISNEQKKIQLIDVQIDGFTKEKSSTVDGQNIKELDNIILQLQNDKNARLAKIASLEAKSNLDDSTISIYMSAYESSVNSIINRLDRTLDLVDFYQYAFGKLGNTKQLYLGIWDTYLHKNLSNTNTMIFSLINRIILNIINQKKNNDVTAESKMDLNDIVNFLSIVKNYIEAKNPNANLDDDPELEEEFRQIIYLINLIITPAMKNIVFNQIYQGFMELNGTLITDPTTILDEISSVQFNGQTIESYLTNVLPLLAVKYYTSVYNNAFDGDRRITSSFDLYLPIIQIIKANKLVRLEDESLMIQNIKDYLIPFMSNTYQYFIHHLRLTIYGYERYLLNTYQLTKIAQLLI